MSQTLKPPTDPTYDNPLVCSHEWEVAHGGWGVLLGVSKCKRCGKVASERDFPNRQESREEPGAKQ